MAVHPAPAHRPNPNAGSPLLRLAAPNNNGRRVSGSTPHHSRRMSNTRAVKVTEPRRSGVRREPEVEALGSAQDEHRQARQQVTEQHAEEAEHRPRPSSWASTSEPVEGGLKQIHAFRDVLATDGVGEAEVPFTARTEGRPGEHNTPSLRTSRASSSLVYPGTSTLGKT